ncbi:MAG: sigma-70 family RNA polymerase sigma factor [Mameliella sp.]|nr:sigma-70 family RNA polymerase sigma factor [Phaeodactylibacter sp.]
MEKPDATCNPSSFRKLYDQLADAVRNFIYYKSGNTGFAEDTVQESFLRLWKKCADVPFEKAKSFVFTVANRLLLDNVKHQKVKLRFSAHKPPEATHESPQFILEQQEFKEKLERAISELPEAQRIVFLMNRIDKMKYREIAEALALSQKAVEKRMHQALLVIREKIGNI